MVKSGLESTVRRIYDAADSVEDIVDLSKNPPKLWQPDRVGDVQPSRQAQYSNLPVQLAQNLARAIPTLPTSLPNQPQNGASPSLVQKRVAALQDKAPDGSHRRDGRRVVPSTSAGTVDVSILPEPLIQRVDTVTGGVSAVYGSDAVAGVVNFVLNDRLEGVKLTAQAGEADAGDADVRKFELAAGTSLLDGRNP